MPKAPSGPRPSRRRTAGVGSPRDGVASHANGGSVRPSGARRNAAASAPTTRAMQTAGEEKPTPAVASQLTPPIDLGALINILCPARLK